MFMVSKVTSGLLAVLAYTPGRAQIISSIEIKIAPKLQKL